MPLESTVTGWEEDTIPFAQRVSDTLELPAVEPGPWPPVATRPVPLAPGAPPARRAAARRAPVRRGGRRWLAGLIVVLLLAVAGALGYRLAGDGPAPSSAGGSGTSPALRSVTSVDPSGGSGLRRSGTDPGSAVWRTQHYRSAEFGGLKPGVGLLLDLGTARRLSSVRTRVEVAGGTVELRAGNSPGSAPGAYQVVDREVSVSGQVTLRAADGGSHRYWLVWIPKLGRDGGGYSAGLRGLTLRG